jgi:hypothetical protein
MIEQRILQEQMALAQRRQAAEEQHRAAMLAEQQATRGQQGKQFEATHGLANQRFSRVEVPTADAQVRASDATTARTTQQTGFDAGREKARTEALAQMAANPETAPFVNFANADIPIGATDPTDVTGERDFGRRVKLTQIQGDQNVRSAQAAAANRQERWVRVPFFNKETGQNEIYYGPERMAPTGTMSAPIPAALTTGIAQGGATIGALEDLETLFKPEFVGPAAGRWLQMKASLPESALTELPPGFADFAAANAAFKNQMIKDITGAQMSEPEARRIMQQIPDVTNRPDVWQARYRQSLANRERLLERQRMRAGGAAQQGPTVGEKRQF